MKKILLKINDFLLPKKEAILTMLIIAATLSQFWQAEILRKRDDARDLLFDKSIHFAGSVASLAANSAEILLQRDLLETCKYNNKDCGSSEFFLRENVGVRDAIRANAYEAPELANKAVEDYRAVTARSETNLFWASKLFYVFLVLAFIINLLVYPRNKEFMTTNEFMKPENLEKYSFLWSEARLVIAALALLLGGTPPLYWLLGSSIFYGLIGTTLTLSWLISGAASAYLGWRWYTGGQKVFGKKDTRDTIMFFVSVVSGINLGLVPLLGRNIGMGIAWGGFVFTVTALLYIVAAVHLWTRWNAHGKKVF